MNKFLIAVLSIIFSHSIHAESNARLKFDISTRLSLNQTNDEIGSMTPLGFDYHNTIADTHSDVGTFVLQLYATKINNLSPHPPFFDEENDFKLVTRIFNFNYTGLGRSLPNVKVGHIELPYGIEYRVNTNGTLRQYSHGMNLGPKADWGISLNKQHENLEYEFSLTTGGGQDFTNQNNSYVFTGYIGTPSHHNFHYGVSVNKSEINRFERESLAFDAAYYYQLWSMFLEIQVGSKGGLDHHQAFAELNYTTSSHDWLFYLQTRYTETENTTTRKDLIVGGKYRLTTDLSGSVQVIEFIEQNTTQVLAQLRYRF
ncbi:hypothetical protein HR060_16715 [Catenovulum sp. SM1970]|uniref:hypothetical protein n=1 Tax=Marinifaba aquimaris TaxID=2741323 RepID=UPI001571AF46|nr:hypothetical protein [Marinifaba aquimaris]NTS78488.1 hypothetical protein [Marinifaba aquimaris]